MGFQTQHVDRLIEESMRKDSEMMRSKWDGMLQGSFKPAKDTKTQYDEDANNKKCPVCWAFLEDDQGNPRTTWIEKDDGCQHMECRVCKGDFCWACMDPVYDKYCGTTCKTKKQRPPINEEDFLPPASTTTVFIGTGGDDGSWSEESESDDGSTPMMITRQGDDNTPRRSDSFQDKFKGMMQQSDDDSDWSSSRRLQAIPANADASKNLADLERLLEEINLLNQK